MPHECNNCHKTFTRKSSLALHLEKNICEKYNKLPYSCKHCSKRYAFKKSLLAHVQNKHSINDLKSIENSCPMCNKQFSKPW